ncbi:hypothetical protein ACFQ3N_11825 [Virgibacillus byunsanensis]|uniref:MotA/TolQ/ExbB proton channel domain-containing protein n=1 Tax=Virgibacillus byunsanensis TaxID=570945 RepID=A0ABW3LM14_9BACI
MDRWIIIGIVLVGYILYSAIKQKETWKKLSVMQNIGVLVTFVGVISAGGYILFYGVRFLIGFTSNEIISIIIQFITAIIVVIFCMLVFSSLVSKITNGLLPKKRKR